MSEIIRFHAIAAGGEAIGRDAQNRAVFAPFGAPDDVCEVEILKTHKNFARGQIRHVLQPSFARIEPPCPFFRPQTPATSCGGCQIQHLDLSAQLGAKTQIVRDALERVGGLRDFKVENCVASPQTFNYRNKADFVVGSDAQIGFFVRESHDLVDITTCPIQKPENNEILTATRAILAPNSAPPLRRFLARTATNGESLAILSFQSPWPAAQSFAHELRARVPNLVGVLARDLASKSSLQILEGRNWLEETVGNLILRVSGDAFFQINGFLTPFLVETALEMAQIQAGERALDLFCGVGLFSLALAQKGARVLGVEAHAGAIEDAKFNARKNHLRANFRAQNAQNALKNFKPGDFDLILLDPPRAGAAECLSDLIRLAPRRLVYISCDPATLARDAKILSRHFPLRRVVPFDLFPQTAHVETLTLWEKI